MSVQFRDIFLVVLAISVALLGWARFGAEPASSAEPSVNRLEARDFGRAVNLGFADLPELISTPASRVSPAETRIEDDVAECSGIEGGPVLKVRSPKFISGDTERPLEIQSETYVGATREAIDRAAQRALSPRGIDCFLTGLRRTVALDLAYAPGYELKSVAVTRTGGALASVPRSWSLRTTALYADPEGGQLKETIDVLGFFQGPAAVTLTLSGSPDPVPAARAQRLLELLHLRSTMNPLPQAG